jgi:hypothetical protein
MGIFVLSLHLMAQTAKTILPQKHFTTAWGGGWQMRKDSRFSPLTYSGIGASLQTGYERQSEKWLKQFDVWGGFHFAQSRVRNGYNKIGYASRGGLSYSAMRRIKADDSRFCWYLGGTVLGAVNFLYYGGNVNNQYSYNAPIGLGASTIIQKNRRFWRRNLVFQSQLTMPVAAVNLRPTYIGFTNEDFLKAQTGFLSLHNWLYLDWRWSVEIPLSTGNKWRLIYRWEYSDDRQGGRLQSAAQTFLLQTVFNLPIRSQSKTPRL